MVENLLYSVNTVVPIFIVVVLGAVLKRIGFLDADFFSTCDKLVFKVALPITLFMSITSADPEDAFEGGFILFCVLGVIGSMLIMTLLVPLFIKDNRVRGAFIQGAYRSNFAILGIPLAQNMFGDSGAAVISTVMPFAIGLFNVIAVIILSIFAPEDKKLPPRKLLAKIVRNVVTNPLILSIIIALPVLIFRIPIVTVVHKSLTYVGNLATPLALMSIGATFSFEGMKGKFGTALASATLRTIVVPASLVTLAALLGFRNEQLGVVLILFGAPTAVSSYIMAKNMGSDHELASQIILLTTFMCVFTLFIGIFILKSLNLV